MLERIFPVARVAADSDVLLSRFPLLLRHIPGKYKKDFQSWKNRGFCTGKIHKFLGKSRCSNTQSTSGVHCADSDPEGVLNHPVQGFVVFYARVKPIFLKTSHLEPEIKLMEAT